MLQWIFTILFLAGATAYALWRTIRYFRRPRKGASPCDQFQGDCAQCLKNARKNDVPASLSHRGAHEMSSAGVQDQGTAPCPPAKHKPASLPDAHCR